MEELCGQFSYGSFPTVFCFFDLISSLIHARSEKFEAVDTTWTGDLMIVTELREDDVQIAPLTHFLWKHGLECHSCLGTICVLKDLLIRGNHGVMGARGKLHTWSQEGDGAGNAAIEDRGGIRKEPVS